MNEASGLFGGVEVVASGREVGGAGTDGVDGDGVASGFQLASFGFDQDTGFRLGKAYGADGFSGG